MISSKPHFKRTSYTKLQWHPFVSTRPIYVLNNFKHFQPTPIILFIEENGNWKFTSARWLDSSNWSQKGNLKNFEPWTRRNINLNTPIHLHHHFTISVVKAHVPSSEERGDLTVSTHESIPFNISTPKLRINLSLLPLKIS